MGPERRGRRPDDAHEPLLPPFRQRVVGRDEPRDRRIGRERRRLALFRYRLGHVACSIEHGPRLVAQHRRIELAQRLREDLVDLREGEQWRRLSPPRLHPAHRALADASQLRELVLGEVEELTDLPRPFAEVVDELRFPVVLRQHATSGLVLGHRHQTRMQAACPHPDPLVTGKILTLLGTAVPRGSWTGPRVPAWRGPCPGPIDDVSRCDTSTGVQGPKERWIHTRISETLGEALKREARRRRQPVSLLVRNVLEGTLDLVEDIVETSLGGGSRQRDRRRGAAPDHGYGWAELVLNRAATCARCATSLTAGAEAWRGLSDRPGLPVFLCHPCVDRLRRPAGSQKQEEKPR